MKIVALCQDTITSTIMNKDVPMKIATAYKMILERTGVNPDENLSGNNP